MAQAPYDSLDSPLGAPFRGQTLASIKAIFIRKVDSCMKINLDK
jgi:hypothetical protein